MSGRVALVTGSNKGIGLSIVRQLCRRFDGDVVLCSRDGSRGKAAIAQLESEGLKPKLLQLAIDDPESVTQARNKLVSEFGGLDVLVNNAAIAYMNESVKPRIEIAKETMAVNYFATSSVCDNLFPILRPGARVVTMSASAGLLMRISSEALRSRLSSPLLTRDDIEDLIEEYMSDIEAKQEKAKGWPTQMFPIYSMSKLFLTAMTWIQDREFQADRRNDLVINAVHPGFVNTDMTMRKGTMSPDDGAIAPVTCCLIPPNGQPRGQYVWFDNGIVDWAHDNIAGAAPSKKK